MVADVEMLGESVVARGESRVDVLMTMGRSTGIQAMANDVDTHDESNDESNVV